MEIEKRCARSRQHVVSCFLSLVLSVGRSETRSKLLADRRYSPSIYGKCGVIVAETSRPKVSAHMGGLGDIRRQFVVGHNAQL